MMLAPEVAAWRQAGHHVRPHRANEPDEVADNLVAAPFGERLIQAEGKTKVDGAREVLLCPIEAVRDTKVLLTVVAGKVVFERK